MYAVTLLAIVLPGFLSFSSSDKDMCDLYAAVGQTMELPFVYNQLANTDVLSWTHNGTIVFNREQTRVSVGKQEDVSQTGSLLLKNLNLSSGGWYQATVRHPNRTLVTLWTSRLCTMDKVSQPRLSYFCDLKIGFVNLSCHVANPQDLSFSWTVDDINLLGATKQTLNVSLDKEKNFACRVKNRFSTERSDTVRPVCKNPPPTSPATTPVLLCFTSKTIIAVLGGGAAVFLLLLVILAMLCQRQGRGKSDMCVSGKGDLRMVSVKQQRPERSSPDYETMNPADFPTSAFPEPLSRTCHTSASTPSESLPQLHQAAAREPSPVPKPRTKNPQTPNMSTSLKSLH
ncbi:uncharacterized protein LOC133402752 [Phycodurus eques]|uniref:uncharacterized protein LOC133402752 n=1 Tax=Phycodurus eques TaxID=693459 RepID=UPI002ACD73C7|nr:uncharacterized protein LOC133402752 [Phycodurus eques]